MHIIFVDTKEFIFLSFLLKLKLVLIDLNLLNFI